MRKSAKLEIEKSSRFVEYEHAKIKEKLRSKSQERDKKINNAHRYNDRRTTGVKTDKITTEVR